MEDQLPNKRPNFVGEIDATAFDNIFPAPTDLGPRSWGSESLLGLVQGEFSLKRLEMRTGSRGGLQYHRLKHEVAVLVSGVLCVRYVGEDGKIQERTVHQGEVVHFAPGVIHQEIAITDCIIIEASTPHFNDRVRVEHLFGEESEGGLPTTLPTDIVSI